MAGKVTKSDEYAAVFCCPWDKEAGGGGREREREEEEEGARQREACMGGRLGGGVSGKGSPFSPPQPASYLATGTH